MALWNVLPIFMVTFQFFVADISGSDVNKSMPDLSNLVLYTDKQVYNSGKLIKGLYYDLNGKSEHVALAFHNACNLVLEKRPFLVVIFDLSQAYFDGDRDGITDKVSSIDGGIDPADFYMIMPDAGSYCSDPEFGL
jgi:hypothetical protein